MQTVKSCCCGCTLRTGTLILLWLGAILTGLSIVSAIAINVSQNSPFPYVLIEVVIRSIITGIYAMGIYGVEKERPAYLKPYLGFQVFSLVFIIIAMIVVPVFGIALLPAIEGSPNAGQAKGAVAVGIVGAEIGGLIGLGLTYYFFIVVLSFYKELKGEIPRQ